MRPQLRWCLQILVNVGAMLLAVVLAPFYGLGYLVRIPWLAFEGGKEKAEKHLRSLFS